jgi:hypothetical protein
MSVPVQLPDDVADRLNAEATRRGVSIEQVAAEVLSRNLPAPGKHRLRFVGIGASGRTEPMDLNRERAELAARKLSDVL